MRRHDLVYLRAAAQFETLCTEAGSPFWLAARFLLPNVMRELVKYGADPNFVHESHTVTEGLFQKRTQRLSAAEAAKVSGGGGREALMLETVKVALELQ